MSILKRVVMALIIWRLLHLFVVTLAAGLIPADPTFQAFDDFSKDAAYFWGIAGNFDATNYMLIAERGYDQDHPGFFPLLPILLYLITKIFPLSYLTAGLIISHLSLGLALYVIYRLFKIDQPKDSFGYLLLIILTFPTSFFYTMVYNDALFLLLASLSLFWGRQQRWILASIAASLATLTRLNGLALSAYLLAEFLIAQQVLTSSYPRLKIKSWSATLMKLIKSGLKEKAYAALLIPGAFLGYLFYLEQRFGAWDILFTSMKKWDQDRVVLPIQVLWRYFKILFLYPSYHLNYWVAFGELLAFLLYLGLLIYSFGRIRFSYWLFFLVSLTIPSLTGTFQGMPRYGLHLYPIFLILFLLFRNSPSIVRVGYLALMTILSACYLAYYSQGYFVA